MPNLLQSAGRWLAHAGGDPSPDLNDPRIWGGQVTSSTAGIAVTADTAMDLDVVQSVLERLGGTVSTLPLMVFKRDDDGDGRAPATDHPLYKILHDRPNRRQTHQEFFDEQQRHLSFWRNSYSLILPDPITGHPIGELDPIHPSRMVKIERRPDGWIYYSFRRLPPAVGNDVYREDEVFHVRKAPLTEDGLRGKAVFETARETFGRALAVEQFGALYFKNGGSGGGVLKHPGNFKSKEEERDALESWRSGSTGVNRHKDRLLKYGLDYQQFLVNNDEAQFIETKKEMGVAVCRLWNMPPHMVGLLDKATFSNIEQQAIEYVVFTLAPWIAAWEQAASRDLLIGDDQTRYFVEFNVAGLLRGDFKTRWTAYAQGRQWGWLSINDVRKLENLPDIGPKGDDYMTPLNMVPAGTAPAPVTPADDPASDPLNPADPGENDDAP